jgi:hypothetical protein
MAFTLVIPDVSLLGHEWQEWAELGPAEGTYNLTRTARSNPGHDI